MPAKYYNNLNFTKDDDFNKLFDNTVKINVQLLDKFGTVKAGALYDTELTKKEEFQAVKELINRTRRADFTSLDLGFDFVRIQTNPDVLPPRSIDYRIYDGDFVNELVTKFNSNLGNFLTFGEAGSSITNRDLFFNVFDGDFRRTRNFVIAAENDKFFLPLKSKTTPGAIEPVGLHPGQFLSGSLENDMLDTPAGAILGLKGNDKIVGDAGNNILLGGRGNDVIDGGDGIDTVVFGANFADYEYSRLDDGSSVFSRTSAGSDREYVDTVKNVEYAQFRDQVVQLPLPVPQPPPLPPDNRVTLNFKTTLDLSLSTVTSRLDRGLTGNNLDIEVSVTFDTPGSNYINVTNLDTSFNSFEIQRATVIIDGQVFSNEIMDPGRSRGEVGVTSGLRAAQHSFGFNIVLPKDNFLFGERFDRLNVSFQDVDSTLFQQTQSFQGVNFTDLDHFAFLRLFPPINQPGGPLLQLSEGPFLPPNQRTPFSVDVAPNPPLPIANNAPIAVNNFADTEINQEVAIAISDLLLNDTDLDRDPLSLVEVKDPFNGTVRIEGDKVIFTPKPDFKGAGYFNYTISDGKGGTDTGRVEIAIDSPDVRDPSAIARDDLADGIQNTPVSIPIATLLSNDIKTGDKPLTLESVGNARDGSVVRDGDNLIFTPSAGFLGQGRFDYTVKHEDGTTDTATVTVTIAPSATPNSPPIAADDRAETLQNEALSIPNADLLANDSDRDRDPLNLTGVSNAVNGTVQLQGGSILFTPQADFNGEASFDYTIDDGKGGTDTATVQVTVKPPILPPAPAPEILEYYNDGNWFGINSPNSQTLKLSLTGQNTNAINELGMFRVDDAAGRIDGIAPGAAGYLEAAMARSRVVMSALSSFSDSIFPNLEPARYLQVEGGSYWGFYLVRNGTADAVKVDLASGKTPTNLAFGFVSAGDLQVEEKGQNTYSLNFNDGTNNADFDDFQTVLTVTSEPMPLGSNLQDRNQGELIDLRDRTGFQTATFLNLKEAAYRNTLGFYAVDNEAGLIGAIAPGDSGYAAAALERRVDSTQGFEGGKLLAPFLIANATIDEFLATNPENQAGGGLYAYFAYIGANPDRIDHVRLLGNNTFAFEDLYGGGDLDYDDAVIQVNFA